MILSTKTKVYDALVVGSGASGGWVAKELTEQGMEVLRQRRFHAGALDANTVSGHDMERRAQTAVRCIRCTRRTAR